jgi:hypothetical protein
LDEKEVPNELMSFEKKQLQQRNNNKKIKYVPFMEKISQEIAQCRLIVS